MYKGTMKARIVLSILISLFLCSCLIEADDAGDELNLYSLEGPDASVESLCSFSDWMQGKCWWTPPPPPPANPDPNVPLPPLGTLQSELPPDGGVYEGIGTSPIVWVCFPGMPICIPMPTQPKACACEPIPACCTPPLAPTDPPDEPGPTDTTG